MEGFVPSLYASLGLYIPLIVVNCIILGRAEAYAMKNGPILSAFDGIGMGLGFTFGLTCIVAGIASIAYSINDVWAALDIKNYLNNQSTYNTIVEDNYVDPARARMTFPEQKQT